jgi:predicted dehydrogenase
MMGRNHARVLGARDDVNFVGAVDPGGDRYRAMRGRDLFPNLGELLNTGVEAVVCAAPTKFHEELAVELANSNVHTLVEKPIAETLDGAHRIEAAFARSKANASVGHIERYNPALVSLKQRLDRQELGRLFQISTERISPFPSRIQDVGVIKDLATHDIDIVSWLTGLSFESVFASTAHKMGRPNEDLLSAIGFLRGGPAIEMTVNWLTPMKKRSVTVLGEKGAFIADLLTADLTFHANAENVTEWDELVHLRGVSEGDMIRYALDKKEPLVAELDAFLAMARGNSDAPVVSLESGIHALQVAEALTMSASSRQAVDVDSVIGR